MKMKIFLALALFSVAVVFTGCISRMDGRIYPGNPFTHDKLARRYERSVEQILTAAREVIQHNGTLVSEDPKTNMLIAKIDQRTVYIKATPVDDKVTEVIIQVLTRTNSGDIQTASELSEQIAVRLAVTR